MAIHFLLQIYSLDYIETNSIVENGMELWDYLLCVTLWLSFI